MQMYTASSCSFPSCIGSSGPRRSCEVHLNVIRAGDREGSAEQVRLAACPELPLPSSLLILQDMVGLGTLSKKISNIIQIC